jgi:hypothetical protein
VCCQFIQYGSASVSFVLIMGSALVVSGAIVYSSVVGLREQAVAESTHSE